MADVADKGAKKECGAFDKALPEALALLEAGAWAAFIADAEGATIKAMMAEKVLKMSGAKFADGKVSFE